MNTANRINSLAQGPPPVFRLHQLGAMSRPEGYPCWISNHRRSLLRHTLAIKFRRERLELDGSPSAEETLALAIQKLRPEYQMRRYESIERGRHSRARRSDRDTAQQERQQNEWYDLASGGVPRAVASPAAERGDAASGLAQESGCISQRWNGCST